MFDKLVRDGILVAIDIAPIALPLPYVYDGDDTYVILLLVLKELKSIVSVPLMVIVSIVLLDIVEQLVC
jgi:hypothetical protein